MWSPQQSEKEQEIAVAIGELVRACTFDRIDTNNAPMFDVEYIFLQLRSKSVGEKVELTLTCPDDEETKVPIEVDLNDVQIQVSNEHTNELSLSDTIKMIMKYPVLGDMKGIPKSANQVQQVFHILTNCVTSFLYELRVKFVFIYLLNSVVVYTNLLKTSGS